MGLTMADAVINDRRRIVKRDKDVDGREVLTITDWNLVTLAVGGQALEPVSTKLGTATLNPSHFPIHGFIYVTPQDRFVNGFPIPNINTLPA
tara:strand:+ start:135 stop:410 length:276 start_codon:yes stop_codon:yes gene_type:complete